VTLRPRHRLRLAADGVASPAITVRTRAIALAAFGDVNFGDGVGAVMNQRGALWPWRGVASMLRRADVAFGNLECAISRRGYPVAKQFNFRGSPDHLARVVRFAGLDVLNLANSHAGDYRTTALLDTVRAVRANGVLAVGAGDAARRPPPAGHHPARPADRVRRLLGHRPGIVRRRPRPPGDAVRVAGRDRSGRACRTPLERCGDRDVPLGHRARDG